MVKHRLTIQAGLCLVGCLQLIAFTSLLFQLPYLYGRQGVQPVSTALGSAQAVQQQLQLSGGGISLPPSLIWFHDVLGFTAEAMLVAICTTGWLLAATAACGAAHPLVFTALWLLYLSFVSLGGSFIEYGDEVLLEVSFAAIWLAMAHSCNKKAHQQQQQQEAATGQLPHLPGLRQHPQPSQRLSGVTLLLCRWLLFRLLLVTSTFSATLVCGRDPVLASCFKTLVAHGQPHATTRWLQMLPAPLAAAGTAVMLLELPAAFLVLLYVPALQHATAAALLALQLLRISWGPAGMANLAAAVLSFMLLDEARWVPVVLKLARVLGLTAGPGSSMQAEGGHQQLDNPARPALSRSSSVTSMVSVGVAEEGADSRELGLSILDSYNWVLPAALAAVVLCMGLMLGYDTQLGLLLRPSPHQLYRALQLAVPLATLAWAATAAVACWKAVSVSWSACKADAAAAKSAADLESEPAPQAAAAAMQHPPAARSPEPYANGNGLANGYSPGAERPGRYLHFRALTPPRAADVAAALLRAAEEAPADGMDEPVEPLANGDAAAHAAANDGAAAGPSKAAPTRGKATRGRGGRAGGRAAAKAASAEQPAALTATAGAKHQGAGEAFAGLVADPRAAPGGPPAAAAAANGNAAVAAPEGDAAEAAEAVPQAAAVAGRRRARKSVLGVWAPAVCAVAAAVALLVVFVAGAPQLLMAVDYSQAAIRHFVPGPILRASQLGRSFGVASGSSSCRDAFLATQQAAVASGPGALVHFEPFVMNEAAGSWKKVPLQYSLGSSQLRRARSSWWRGLLGARGWFQTRLQAKMAAAAAAGAGQEEEMEPWLVVLANKIVEGSSDLVGLLDRPTRPYDYVTIGRVAYRPGDADWHMDTAGHTPAVQTQPRGSVYLQSFMQSFQAAPGHDGWLVAFVEALARSLSGPVVLAGLLLAVLLRHLLLPGGLLQECQRAV